MQSEIKDSQKLTFLFEIKAAYNASEAYSGKHWSFL